MNPLTGMKRPKQRPRDVQQWLHSSSSIKSDLGTTTIEDLSDGVLVEIFVRFNVKYAHQCKSVCKRWLTLISTSWFIRSFVRHQITIISNGRKSPPWPPLRFPFAFITEQPKPHHEKHCLRLISSHDMFGLSGWSLSHLPCYESDESDIFITSVLASSNDLILCESRFSPGFYYIYNPFTKHWAKMPSGGPFLNGKYRDGCPLIGFVCDPFYKVVDNENGYHTIDTTYRYKIVRVSYFMQEPMTTYCMEIFSSETGKWSELNLKVACPQLLQVIDPAYTTCSVSFLSNGKLHWMWGTHYIFAYDPFNNNKNNNIVEVIDLPVELRGAKNVHLGVSGGRLRLLQFDEYITFKVWELEDYSAGKWCIVKEVTTGSMNYLGLIKFMEITMTIVFHPYEENIVYIWCPSYASSVISCNMQYGLFETVITGSTEKRFYNYRDKVFLLLQPWFPTPVFSPHLPY